MRGFRGAAYWHVSHQAAWHFVTFSYESKGSNSQYLREDKNGTIGNI
jgi:hypothetical protein